MSSENEERRTHTLKIVADYQKFLSEQNWEKWIGLWSDDGILEFPFAPPGRQRRYVGKQAILAYMSATPGKIAIDSLDHIRLFPAQDPNIAVAELTIRGHAVPTGLPYNQSYVLFFEVKSGLLHHYREYWNPVVSMDALGGREAWTASFGTAEETR